MEEAGTRPSRLSSSASRTKSSYIDLLNFSRKKWDQKRKRVFISSEWPEPLAARSSRQRLNHFWYLICLNPLSSSRP